MVETKPLIDADGVIVNLGVKLRAPGQYDADAASLEAGISFDPEEGKTQQQFKDEVDIVEIVRKFGLGERDLPMSGKVPLSGDFTEVTDFHSAMNLVIEAQSAFDSLSAELRERFGNDPGRLIEFLEDPANKEEAQKLGLVNKPPEKARDAVQAIDELASKLAPASSSIGQAKPA